MLHHRTTHYDGGLHGAYGKYPGFGYAGVTEEWFPNDSFGFRRRMARSLVDEVP